MTYLCKILANPLTLYNGQTGQIKDCVYLHHRRLGQKGACLCEKTYGTLLYIPVTCEE